MKPKYNTMYRQQQFFEGFGVTQRPIPEQREFEVAYYNFMTKLPKIVDVAFESTHQTKRNKRPMSVNRNWFANELNGNVLDGVAQKFPQLIKYTGSGTYCLMLDYKYECYIKKLIGKKLFPSYNHSKRSKRLTNQQALPNEEPIPIIYLGWTLKKGNDKITGYYAVCIKGEERLWASDLTTIAAPHIINVEKPAENITPTVTVTIKKDKRKDKN